MTSLTEDLQHLETLWTSLGLPDGLKLRPGLPADEVRNSLMDLAPNPPVDLVTWFSWHNGSPQGRPVVTLGPSAYEALSLDGAKQERQIAIRLADEFFDPDEESHPRYRGSWLPIGGQTGQLLCVSLADDELGPAGTVFAADVTQSGPQVPAAESLREVVRIWTSVLEEGRIVWAGTGWDRPEGSVPIPYILRGLIV